MKEVRLLNEILDRPSDASLDPARWIAVRTTSGAEMPYSAGMLDDTLGGSSTYSKPDRALLSEAFRKLTGQEWKPDGAQNGHAGSHNGAPHAVSTQPVDPSPAEKDKADIFIGYGEWKWSGSGWIIEFQVRAEDEEKSFPLYYSRSDLKSYLQTSDYSKNDMSLMRGALQECPKQAPGSQPVAQTPEEDLLELIKNKHSFKLRPLSLDSASEKRERHLLEFVDWRESDGEWCAFFTEMIRVPRGKKGIPTWQRFLTHYSIDELQHKTPLTSRERKRVLQAWDNYPRITTSICKDEPQLAA